MSALDTSIGVPTALTVPTALPVPIAAPGDLAALMGAFNEVTAKLTATHEALQSQVAQLQAELSEAKDAVERSRHLAMLGEMAAGIAHEVRNPLGSIALYAKMLQDDLTDRPPQQDTARKIAVAVRRLEAVVGDVLSFARPIKLRVEDLDARELLESSLAAARSESAEWSGVEVKWAEPKRTGTTAPTTIHGDANLLYQALINVIRNAAQAMHEHSAPKRELHLSYARRRVRTEEGRTRSMIGLSVRDTGPGIAPEVAARIFQPFFTTRAAGTGLGLPIVHRIADAHGGRVTIENHPSGGAVVTVLLPA